MLTATRVACRYEDYDFQFKQLTAVSKSIPSDGTSVSGLSTYFVITNTGSCTLYDPRFVDYNGNLNEPLEVWHVKPSGEVEEGMPRFISQGEAVKLRYTWPALTAGEHRVTLVLQFLDANDKYYQIPGGEFPLEVKLTLTHPTSTPAPVPTPTLTPTPCCYEESVYCTRQNCSTDPGTGEQECTEESYVCGTRQVCGPCP